jgi:hypothetical protein
MLTDTATTMGRHAHLESVKIPFHGCRIDPDFYHALFEHLGIMHSLSTGEYFLSTHHEVIRI